MAVRIRKDDQVIIIAGDHKGARGKVLRVLDADHRVIVEGVNMVWRHVRRSRKYPQGGRIQKEAPIHLSNVQPLDPKTGRGCRIRIKIERDAAGKIALKQRVSAGRNGGSVLSEITRAKKTPAGAGKAGN